VLKQRKEELEGYKVLFSGRADRRVHGVGIAVRVDPVRFQLQHCHCVSPRLMWLTGVFDGVALAIFSAYGPTNALARGETVAEAEARRAEFWQMLAKEKAEVRRRFPSHAHIVMGDFNARVGAPGPEGGWGAALGARIEDQVQNANGLSLLGFCVEESMAVANSWHASEVEGVGTGTWHAPARPGVFHATLDHISVPEGLLPQVVCCGVVPALTPTGDTDHRATVLVLPNRAASVQQQVRATQDKRARGEASAPAASKARRVDGAGLQKRLRTYVQTAMGQAATPFLDRLAALEAEGAVDPPELEGLSAARGVAFAKVMADLRQIVSDGCTAELPPPARSAREQPTWFANNEVEMRRLIKVKNTAFAQMCAAPRGGVLREELRVVFGAARAQVHEAVQQFQSEFWTEVAGDMMVSFHSGATGDFYAKARAIYGTSEHVTSGPLGLEGVLLPADLLQPLAVTLDQRVERWFEHFKQLLNQLVEVSRDVEQFYPDRREEAKDLANDFTMDELLEAVAASANGKAPGTDGLPIEVDKCLFELPEYRELTLRGYNEALHTGVVPDAWKEVQISILYKSGDRSVISHLVDRYHSVNYWCIVLYIVRTHTV
jgi:hypothetical protein